MDSVRRLSLLVVLVAVAAAGCARTHAKTQPEPIALDVPLPPDRVVAPPEPDTPPSPPEPEPQTRQEKPTRTRPAPARAESRTEPSRADKKAEPPPAAEPAKPPPAQPAPTLQQAMPASPEEVERQVREQIAQAQRDLGRVDYGGLGADAKSQYDTAKRFIEQADQALKDKNLVLASKLAEKAAGLAGVLVGR